ncbi:uncharacterized protein LOC107625335 isoform X2 [Arachis ipaensis]|uniref:uncharacterized protein LOC107625335 isoform X2 n=1 Tax=Arachis ipaensis TaxID=130454 RepID=UPI000A2B7F83|nr:uncharacterized protein LOC107625335 isoform X2 [Arachis ipaensis]
MFANQLLLLQRMEFLNSKIVKEIEQDLSGFKCGIAHLFYFGTAKFLKPGSYSWTTIAGTFGYAAPAIKKRMEKDIDKVGKIAHGVKTKVEAVNRDVMRRR